MASQELEEIFERVERLSLDERLELIARLAETARQGSVVQGTRRKWSEIRGAAPYPLVGEDAQAWVSRTRREADDSRQEVWINAHEDR